MNWWEWIWGLFSKKFKVKKKIWRKNDKFMREMDEDTNFPLWLFDLSPALVCRRYHYDISYRFLSRKSVCFPNSQIFCSRILIKYRIGVFDQKCRVWLHLQVCEACKICIIIHFFCEYFVHFKRKLKRSLIFILTNSFFSTVCHVLVNIISVVCGQNLSTTEHSYTLFAFFAPAQLHQTLYSIPSITRYSLELLLLIVFQMVRLNLHSNSLTFP